MEKTPVWKKNLRVSAVSVFLAGIAFSEITPFLSLYIDTLGKFTHQELSFWSGTVFSAVYVVAALVSPIWGKLADKKGRKPMILRASLGMAIVFTLMGVAQNVWQLLFLRGMQGVFAGFISNSNALVAAETPKHKSGKALGIMSSCTTGGQLLGPFAGGALSQVFSYRVTFFITGVLLFTCFVLSILFIHEDDFVPIKSEERGNFKDTIKQFKSGQLIVGLLLTTLIIQAANNSINPIVSLYVRSLMHGAGQVVFVSGVIAALPGIATVAAASYFGGLGDRIGTHKIILGGLIGSIILFFLTAFVQNTVELGVCRFLIGFTDACLFPQVQTMLTKYSPRQLTSRVFSWNQSAMYIGNIFGPLIGSTVSAHFGYSAVFLVTSMIVVLNLLLYRVNILRNI
ncbi:MFS transporter [Lactobacillus equicursoris]|uniref:MFS transporter n=1 Tax=Lactobacillus equicursoris TaxID=420645 RepID=UPI0024315646|nr:MFS transporter [Lactobacillus equicursoris]MDD6386248.1 MFS transporter [Lactobacillus equicursoris]